MRLLLAALRCEKGEVRANLASHCQVLREAASADCDLAVFPEMSLTGSVDPAAHPERLIGTDASTTDEDFPGLAGLVSPDGSVTARLPDWREGTLVVDIPL